MKELVLFEVDDTDRGALLVEVDDTEPGFDRIARGDELVARAATTLGSALDPLRIAANAIIERVRAIAEPPDEVEVELGLRMNAKFGAVLAASEGEGHIQVRLTWKNPPAT
jgi:hypothetical protein